MKCNTKPLRRIFLVCQKQPNNETKTWANLKKSKKLKPTMRKPWENPKNPPQQNKFCNEMQHKANQEFVKKHLLIGFVLFFIAKFVVCFSLDLFLGFFSWLALVFVFGCFLFLNIIRNSFLLKSKIKMFQWNKTQRKSEKSKRKTTKPKATIEKQNEKNQNNKDLRRKEFLIFLVL